MRRREFITLLGGAAVTWPLTARAQQAKLPTIGFLGAQTPAAQRPWNSAFVQRMHELGWIEGRTVAIEYRWAEGRSERYAEIAAEFIRLKVDIIVTQGTPAVLAAKQATLIIPIVFASAGDPVGTGLVTSLARPGGNATGLSSQQTDTIGKRIEILREVVPGLRWLAIMANVGNPFTVLELGEVQATARTLGLEVNALEIQRVQDIGPASRRSRIARTRFMLYRPARNHRSIRISTSALGTRLPTMSGFIESSSTREVCCHFERSSPDQFRRAAEYVDKILAGRSPATSRSSSRLSSIWSST